MFDSYTEAAFVSFSVLLILLALIVYGTQINGLNDNSCQSAQLKSVAELSAASSYAILQSSAFQGFRQRHAVDACSDTETAKQKALISIESLTENLTMLPTGVRIQLVDVDGQVFADSGHASSKSVTQRPLSKLTNDKVLKEIFDTAEQRYKGDFLPSSNGQMFVTLVPNYPSFALVMSLLD